MASVKVVCIAALASLMGAAGAGAQTVATGAGRTDELSEAAHIDAYLADTSRQPASASERRVTAAEAAASAEAIPPMDPDSPWARGVSGPIDRAQGFAQTAEAPAPCDHKLHGEVGAEIGTGGSKGGYGVVTAPVGKDCWGQVTVGVSSYSGRGYGGYGYGGYDRRGTGYGGTFGYAPRGGSSSLSLGFGAGDGRAPGAGYGPGYGFGPGAGAPPPY